MVSLECNIQFDRPSDSMLNIPKFNHELHFHLELIVLVVSTWLSAVIPSLLCTAVLVIVSPSMLCLNNFIFTGLVVIEVSTHIIRVILNEILLFPSYLNIRIESYIPILTTFDSHKIINTYASLLKKHTKTPGTALLSNFHPVSPLACTQTLYNVSILLCINSYGILFSLQLRSTKRFRMRHLSACTLVLEAMKFKLWVARVRGMDRYGKLSSIFPLTQDISV